MERVQKSVSRSKTSTNIYNLYKYIIKHEVLDPDPIFVYIHQLIEIDKINWIA